MTETIEKNRLAELEEYFLFHDDRPDKNFATDEQKRLQDIYENKLFNEELVDMYDVVRDELQRIPSLKEFGSRYVKSSYLYFIKHHKIDKEDKDYLLSCMKWRAQRVYKSRIYEEYIFELIKEYYPSFDFIVHPLIDSIFGVDLVVVDDTDHFHYIHVTKDTQRSIDKMYKKAKKFNFKINRKKFVWFRYIEKHMKIYYDGWGYKMTRFSKNYFDNQFKKSQGWEVWGDNKLQNFNEQLIKKGIVNKDFRFVSKKGRVLEINENEID